MSITRRSTLQLMGGAGIALLSGDGLAPAGQMPPPGRGKEGSTSIGKARPDAERFIKEALDDFREVPGCAIALAERGKVIWGRAYGRRTLRTDAPFTLSTTHNLGSVTKTYMATLMLTLVDKSRVDLDVDVNEYLPYALRSPFYPEVPLTLRMLLSHTSGLAEVGPEPGPYADSYRAGDLPLRDGEWSRRCLASSAGERDYVYPPESGFWLSDARPGIDRRYSNLAWQPMTDIIQRVAKRDVHSYLRRVLFDPLGIKDSGFRLADADTEPASGYAAVVNGGVRNGLPYDYSYLYAKLQGDPVEHGFVEYVPYTFDVFADGGMRTSALSLVQYGAMWASGGVGANGRRVLSNRAVSAALSLQDGEGFGAADLGQGLGWAADSRRPSGWCHMGGDLGANSFVLLLPEAEAALVAISNVSQFPEGIDELVFGVADRLGL